MKRFLAILAIALLAGSAAAIDVPLTLVNQGAAPTGGSTVFSADLTGIVGLTSVGSIRIEDNNSGVGGANGIFSGFDLDAIFLDEDGDLTTLGDQHYATSYLFQAGTTRPTASPAEMPTAAHPGPVFGSLDATTIDHATATLDVFDSVSVADVDVADGFLTLGDGGTLDVGFAPSIPIGATLFLVLGEVGGQPGEGLDALVTVSDDPIIPEPATLALIGLGLAGAGALRRRRR